NNSTASKTPTPTKTKNSASATTDHKPGSNRSSTWTHETHDAPSAAERDQQPGRRTAWVSPSTLSTPAESARARRGFSPPAAGVTPSQPADRQGPYTGR